MATVFPGRLSHFAYAYAQSFQSLVYYRLDPPAVTKPDLLISIKNHLNSGLPSMFGFTVYSSISQAAANGKIPFPARTEKVVGGHAIMAVGYDDAATITNATDGSTRTGALLIRNSWGTGWGMGGYGYLPYDYVLTGLATDFWAITKQEWVDTGAFK